MRNRILKGHLAVLCVACLLPMGMLTGCGGGNGAYNPTLTGGGGVVPMPSFTLTLTPTATTATQGDAVTSTATLTSVNGFSSPVTFNASGLPAGATATFSPTSVTPTAVGATDTVTISTTAPAGPGSLTGTIQSVGAPSHATTPNGTYAIIVTATGGGVTQQATLTLKVEQP